MKLLIGMPSLDYIHAETMKSLVRLVKRLDREGVDFDVTIQNGTLVYFARDKIACKAINEGYTHVLWIDADMVFQDGILEDLQFSGKDFVSGICHARRPGFGSCLFKSIDLNSLERFEEYPNNTFEVDGCGFGCVLITTAILKEVQETYGTCFTPEKNYGEDLSFCKRVKWLGHKIYAEPSVVLGHIGHITIYPEDHEKWKESISYFGEYKRKQ